MERSRNWLGIAAVVLAGLALVVALAGRFGPEHRFVAYNHPLAPQAPQAPQAPFGDGRFERGAVPPEIAGRLDRELQREELRGWHDGQGFGRGGPHGFQQRHDGFFGPLGMLFGLFNILTKIAALGLLAWLLLRLFQQRQTPPAAPAGPTTPAGHDPRVE